MAKNKKNTSIPDYPIIYRSNREIKFKKHGNRFCKLFICRHDGTSNIRVFAIESLEEERDMMMIIMTEEDLRLAQKIELRIKQEEDEEKTQSFHEWGIKWKT